MKVKELMTSDPACCTPNDPIERAARLMIENDCGEIPVVDGLESRMPIGVITDRDITCRTVGQGLNPLEMTVQQAMTTPLISVKSGDDVNDCYRLMEDHQIRRLPVVDDSGMCVGIVALADIALSAPRADSGEVLKDVSVQTASASNKG